MKIVVPIDGSKESFKVIEFAIQVATTYGDEILLLNIQQTIEELGIPTIKKAAELLDGRGIAYSAKIRVGIPAMEIVNEAAEANVRYVIMEKGKGEEEAIGSVSAHVLKLATCPIIFIPKRAQD